MKQLFLSFLILLTFSSFKKLSNFEVNLIGKCWEISKVETVGYPIYHYKVIDSIGKSPSYKFLKSGKLVVCQNVSWCPVGNSKIVYETVKGKWKIVNDSILQLEHKRYGTDSRFRYKILKLTESELVLSVKLKNGL